MSDRVIRRDDPSLDPQHDAPRVRSAPTDIITRARRYTDDVIGERDPIPLTDDERYAMRSYLASAGAYGDAGAWSDSRLASTVSHHEWLAYRRMGRDRR